MRKRPRNPARAPQHVIKKLHRAKVLATFDRFGDARTAQIREETRLYRETWLLPVLEELIDWAEGRRPDDAV